MSLEELAAEQRVTVCVDCVSKLRGDFWPDGESVDEFISVVRRWRRGEAEAGDKVERWWLSFSDGSNLGCVMVEVSSGGGVISAISKVHSLGINPGGEVAGYRMDDGELGDEEIARWGLDRLISRQELIDAGYVPETQ